MITIYFDGLCRPKNPGGVATYGYLIYRDGEKIKRGYGVVGSGPGMTNNVAEYSALKQAAEWVSQNIPDNEIVIKGDSQTGDPPDEWHMAGNISNLKKICPGDPQAA